MRFFAIITSIIGQIYRLVFHEATCPVSGGKAQCLKLWVNFVSIDEHREVGKKCAVMKSMKFR